MRGDRWSALLRAGLLTAVVDGLFSSLLNVFAYQSTVARSWQGVGHIPFVGFPIALAGGRPATDR